MDIIFDEPIIGGVTGRSGAVNFAGLSVYPTGLQVSMTPLGPSGATINAAMTLMAGDCGRVARAIAEAAAQADPTLRDELATQLRAALVAIECGAVDRPEDGISSFFRR